PNQGGLNIIRLLLEPFDNPFTASGGNGPISEGIQLVPRQLAAQYQSFMLYTSLVAMSQPPILGAIDWSFSLSTNILVPLAVDGGREFTRWRRVGHQQRLHRAVRRVRQPGRGRRRRDSGDRRCVPYCSKVQKKSQPCSGYANDEHSTEL